MRGYGYVQVYSWESVLKQDLVLMTLSAKNWAQMHYVFLFFLFLLNFNYFYLTEWCADYAEQNLMANKKKINGTKYVQYKFKIFFIANNLHGVS